MSSSILPARTPGIRVAQRLDHYEGLTSDVVRKLRRTDELAAVGKTNEEITADLEVSPATLYNWRRTYGGMDVDATKELKELWEQNTPPQAAVG